MATREELDELYSLRTKKIEEDEVVRKELKNYLKELSTDSVFVSVRNDDVTLSISVRAGKHYEYSQKSNSDREIIYFATSVEPSTIGQKRINLLRGIETTTEIMMDVLQVVNNVSNEINTSKKAYELINKINAMKFEIAELDAVILKATEEVLSNEPEKEISIVGKFTKGLKYGDVIYPMDFSPTSKNWVRGAYYFVKKVNPVNIVIDVFSGKDSLVMDVGESLIERMFYDKSLSVMTGNFERVDDISVSRLYLEKLIGGNPERMEYLRVYKTGSKGIRRKREEHIPVFNREWLILSKEEWQCFKGGRMPEFIEKTKDSLSQFAVRWLAHEYIITKNFVEFEKLVDSYTAWFKPENLYLKILLAEGQTEIIKKFFANFSFNERTKDFIINSQNLKSIKTAIEIGVKFNKETYVEGLLTAGKVDLAKILLDSGCLLRERIANRIFQTTNDETVKKFIKMNVFMKDLF